MKRIVLVALMAGLSGPVLFAQHTDHGGGRGTDGRGVENLIKEMNLSPEAEERFLELRTEFQKEMVRKEAEIDLVQIDLRGMMEADNPEKSAIAQKMKEVSDLEHGKKLSGLDHLFAVRDMLTPEQLEVWKSYQRGKVHRGRAVGPHGLRHR